MWTSQYNNGKEDERAKSLKLHLEANKSINRWFKQIKIITPINVQSTLHCLPKHLQSSISEPGVHFDVHFMKTYI